MLYDKKEAARILSVSVKTIERSIASGRLTCRRIASNVRFTQDDLNQFAGARVVGDAEKPSVPLAETAIPPDIIKTLETEMGGINHGTVSLTIHIRDKHPRFVIGRERSFLPGAERG
jgi:excisionase family DNA binding protein